MDKKQLIQQIEGLRKSRVITYLTSDKPGPVNARVAMDIIPIIDIGLCPIDNNQNSACGNVEHCDIYTFLNYTLPKLSNNHEFILADNTSINNENATILLVQSKYETETLPTFTNEAIKLPDLFDDTKTPTSMATQFFKNTRITININNLSNATTAQTNEGKTFSSNSTLAIDAGVTDAGVKINIHQSVMNLNSAGRLVDLNILSWYLLLKYFGYTVSISSNDKDLLNSSKTFIYFLNKFIIYGKLKTKNKKK